MFNKIFHLEKVEKDEVYFTALSRPDIDTIVNRIFSTDIYLSNRVEVTKIGKTDLKSGKDLIKYKIKVS